MILVNQDHTTLHEVKQFLINLERSPRKPLWPFRTTDPERLTYWDLFISTLPLLAKEILEKHIIPSGSIPTSSLPHTFHKTSYPLLLI